MSKRLLLITGVPGVGKTTVLLKAAEALKTAGASVGGMVSREVRENGVRVGFEIQDLASGRCGWLAHVSQKSGPQVGKYRVNLQDLNAVGVQAVLAAVDGCDVVAIDEIGPMELFSEGFREATRKALASDKLVIAVVHWKAQDNLLSEARKREDAELITVTYENREKLPEAIVEKALKFLKQT